MDTTARSKAETIINKVTFLGFVTIPVSLFLIENKEYKFILLILFGVISMIRGLTSLYYHKKIDAGNI